LKVQISLWITQTKEESPEHTPSLRIRTQSSFDNVVYRYPNCLRDSRCGFYHIQDFSGTVQKFLLRDREARLTKMYHGMTIDAYLLAIFRAAQRTSPPCIVVCETFQLLVLRSRVYLFAIRSLPAIGWIICRKLSTLLIPKLPDSVDEIWFRYMSSAE